MAIYRINTCTYSTLDNISTPEATAVYPKKLRREIPFDLFLVDIKTPFCCQLYCFILDEPISIKITNHLQITDFSTNNHLIWCF